MKPIVRLSLLLTCLVTATGNSATNRFGPTGWENNPNFDWAQVFVRNALSGNNPPSYGGVDVVADSEVSCYVIGRFVGATRFGPNIVTNNTPPTYDKSTGRQIPMWQGYLAKYDRQQKFQWVQVFSNALPGRVAVHGNNEVFIVGKLYRGGTATIGNKHFTSPKASDAFLAKLDRNGNVLWVQQAGSSLTFGLALNHNGECFVVGDFLQIAAFEGVTLRGHGSHSVYISKFAQDGSLLWAKTHGDRSKAQSTIANFQVSGATVDFAGNLYASGTVMGGEDPDAVLAKYDSDGNPIWTVTPGGPGKRSSFNVAVDGSGSPHMVGIFSYTACYGEFTVTNQGRYHTNLFHAKYDPSGELQWVRQFLPGDYQFNDVLSVEANGVNLTQIRSAKPAASSVVSKPRLNLAALTAALNAANAANARKSSAPPTSASTSTSPPPLSMVRSGDFLILYWPKEFAGYVLDSCDSLTPFQAWEAETATPEVVGDAIAFSVPIDRAMKFYRLRQP